MALFSGHPGEPVPEENFWTLICNGRLTEADTWTIRLGATPSGPTSADSADKQSKIVIILIVKLLRLQCFDAVGWVARRASGL